MAVLVPTVRLIRQVDNRQDNRFPVARKLVTLTVPDLANTITSSVIDLNGFWPMFVVASPNIPTDTTFDITITDQDGVVVYSDTALTENQSAYVDVAGTNAVTSLANKDLYLAGKYTIKIDFTTALSGDTATFDIIFILVEP